MSQPYPVARVFEESRDAELLAAIAEARTSHGAQRGIDRRYALRLLAAERKRRNARRAAFEAAVARAHMRRAA